jgi:hypothetical protein
MKTWMRFGALFTALLLSTASAQNDLIAAYRSIQGSLEAARTTLRADPAGALARVRGAENVFRRISAQLPPTLSSGASAALKNAETAVARSSGADFAAQAGQIKAVLERGMVETYFTVFNNPSQAVRYASALGSAFKLNAATQKDLNLSTKAGNATRARAIIETQLSAIIGNALTAARDNAGNRANAFSNLSRAANNFLIVQDSPRVGDLNVGEFSTAITTLTSGDTPGFQQAVGILLSQNRSFAERARALTSSAPNKKPVAAAGTKPVTGTKPTVRPASPQPAPAANPPAASSAAPVSNLAAIKASLVKAGIAAPKAEQLAGDLSNRGFNSVGAAIDGVSVKLSSALSKIQDNNVPDGRAAISDAKNSFDSSLRPVVEAADPELATRVSRVFEATEAAAGVRPVDVTVLLGEMDAIRNWSQGQPMSGLQAAVANVQPFWMGWLRGGAFLVAALLFAYPIYLLNLAFGGRNPYWRYIGIAMVLLFIPPLIEGLAWLGSFVAQGTGLRALDGLSSLSVLQNPLAQIAWVVILFLTVGFATVGFRGIASQFGLIRTRNQGVGATTSLGNANFATRNSTPQERSPMNTQQVNTAERTIVEWDEEF